MFNPDSSKIYKQTIAFAGLLQATTLVEQIACNGNYDNDSFTTVLPASLKWMLFRWKMSILDRSTLFPNLALGMKQLQQCPTKQTTANRSLSLCPRPAPPPRSKLRKNAALMEILSSRLQKTNDNLNHFRDDP
ncbi:MAG: DUF489 family protein [Pseudomonadales bacterium]